MDSPGERFARAIAHQDADALCAVLACQCRRGVRAWKSTVSASTGKQAVEEIILGTWFDAATQILELCSVATGQVAEREHVAYRMRVREDGDDYLVEQQAYYRTDGPRIAWMRILCSGFQPIVAEPAARG
jgi:hypothetical protein